MELQDVLTIIDHVARTDALREVEIDDHGYRICVKTDRNRGEGDAGFSGGPERAAGKAGLADRPEAGLAVRRDASLCGANCSHRNPQMYLYSLRYPGT